mgnify:CR=1 FL=1
MAITKKTTIGEVLNLNIETAKFFMEIGMHCLGCPASQGESIEEACTVRMQTSWLPNSTPSLVSKRKDTSRRCILPALFF